ncbi:MAG: glutathione S-transferase family protein [Pseudomonadota bacterium]
MSDFVLYGTPLSPFVRKVQATLHYVDAAYDFQEIDIGAMPDWFLKISPARRIPVLRDNTVGTHGVAGTIPDSSSICLFLDRRFNAGLFGENPFVAGRIAWLEEYSDSVLAVTGGMKLFRPLVFPLYAGEEPDLDTAKKTWNERLPRLFDYLEASLDGAQFFVGDRYSLADISIGAQMTFIDLVAGLPDAERWPALAQHTARMKTQPGFAENLAASREKLRGYFDSTFDLSYR